MTVLGPTTPRFPIGIDDYARLRADGYTYVDKTMLIAEVLDSGAVSLLLPRPRRFGKTLNMSTLRWFLERDPENDRSALFDDTYIWTADDGRYREHFQRYPVIALSFKDVKAHTWADAWHQIRRQLQSELRRLWIAFGLNERYRDDSFVQSRFQTMTGSSAAPVEFDSLLSELTAWAVEATGERAVILIDEYDAPLLAAWQHGYWDEALAFFRPFLSAGLKGDPNVFRGVLTGILRVAKEGIFSGLNNLRTISPFNDALSTAFGFDEREVRELLVASGAADTLDTVRSWYNGYRMGLDHPITVYNPWSVLMFLAEGARTPQSFWKNTSSNDLVHSLLLRHAAAVGPDIERLIRGETFETLIDENVALQQLGHSVQDIWSLLTFSGYLTPEAIRPTRNGFEVALRIPNQEVLAVFEDVFRGFLTSAVGDNVLAALTESMLRGDATEFEIALERTLIESMSYHDFAREAVESVYQAFIVGLLVHLSPTHRVCSNREAGIGRADVLVIPRVPGPGAVLELKTLRHTRDEKPEQALKAAVEQIQSRGYAAEVRAAGATEVYLYGVVFDGKRCWVVRG